MLLVKERPLPKFKKEAPKPIKRWEEGDPVGDCIVGYGGKGPKTLISYERQYLNN